MGDDGHQTLGFQLARRLPDDGPAHPKSFSNFPLHQAGAGRVFGAYDRFPQPTYHLLAQGRRDPGDPGVQARTVVRQRIALIHNDITGHEAFDQPTGATTIPSDSGCMRFDTSLRILATTARCLRNIL
jgi:hypothetical protein